ncbi:MAG: capsid protein [Sanya permutotetra-like virus 2]|nr:MAG: capsid protein [Sanya permutotetra-like virus 2]
MASKQVTVQVEEPKPQRPGGARRKAKVVIGVKAPKAKSNNKATTNTRSRNPPRNRNNPPKYKMQGPASRSVVLEGYDYLGTVEVSTKDKPGVTKSLISLNPVAWQGTRVQQEARLWQRFKPKSLVVEVTTSASRMMAGQYGVAWVADFNETIPNGSDAAMAKLLSFNPSKIRPIWTNSMMRIPISTTQKWYYLHGHEEADSEYGKLILFIASPLANVTSGSATSLIIRIRWSFEFSFPDVPQGTSPDDITIYASAPNYFSDSVSNWKDGKYLTFKWHEGGEAVGFPGGQAKTIYVLGGGSTVQYYNSDGTNGFTKYAVCVTETNDDGQPMLAPVKDLSHAQAWVKSPADGYLLPYKAAGHWVTPENPPWYEFQDTVQLVLTRECCLRAPPRVDATVKVYDKSADGHAREFRKGFHHLMEESTNPVDPQQGRLFKALFQLSQLDFFNFIGEKGLDTYLKTIGLEEPAIPVRKRSPDSDSSFEVVPETSEGSPKPSTSSE